MLWGTAIMRSAKVTCREHLSWEYTAKKPQLSRQRKQQNYICRPYADKTAGLMKGIVTYLVCKRLAHHVRVEEACEGGVNMLANMQSLTSHQGFLLLPNGAMLCMPSNRRRALAHLVCERLAQHVLVEGAREVCIDVLAIMQRLAHNAAHELEEVQVVGAPGLVVLDHAVGVGLEGRPAQGHGYEQREVRVEDLPRHDLYDKML